MQEHLLDIIEKQIQNGEVYNELMVYSRYTCDLAAKIFNTTDQSTEEFKNNCNIFHALCGSMISVAEEFNRIVPTFQIEKVDISESNDL